MKVIRNISNNPLVVHTGNFTGRCPNDRYFAYREEVKNQVEWEKIAEHLIKLFNENLLKISFSNNSIIKKGHIKKIK